MCDHYREHVFVDFPRLNPVFKNLEESQDIREQHALVSLGFGTARFAGVFLREEFTITFSLNHYLMEL